MLQLVAATCRRLHPLADRQVAVAVVVVAVE